MGDSSGHGESGRPRAAGRRAAPEPPSGAEPGARPVTEGVQRHAVRLTAPQSDALARCLPGRRVIELASLRNGTLVATFGGAGYAAWRVFITVDGRVLENAAASEPDPTGAATGQLAIVREADALHLGTLLPRRPGRPPARRTEPGASGQSEDGAAGGEAGDEGFEPKGQGVRPEGVR